MDWVAEFGVGAYWRHNEDPRERTQLLVRGPSEDGDGKILACSVAFHVDLAGQSRFRAVGDVRPISL